MKRALLTGLCFSLSALASEANGERVGVRWHGGLNAVDVTNAVVGEAAGCPFIVKLGVAAAIYNRHSLRGVYGFHAPVTRHAAPAVWADAARAVAMCRTNDPTHGAVNFGCKADVDKGAFTGLHLTVVLGTGRNATYFFKP